MLVVRVALKLNALRHSPVDREKPFEVQLFHPERGVGPDQLKAIDGSLGGTVRKREGQQLCSI